MLLTIGITTYNRIDFLRKAVESVLVQGDMSFEILIGNDYVKTSISKEDLGFNDPRVQIFNYVENKGEMKNLNYLLEMAKGQYFIWLADDDEFKGGLFEGFMKALKSHPDVEFVIPRSVAGRSLKEFEGQFSNSLQVFDTDQFLVNYIKGTFTLQGVYIFYRTELLRDIGGIERMGTGFGPYSDSILTFNLANRFKKFIFMDNNWVLFRTHDLSLSNSSSNLEAYYTAQKSFVQKYKQFKNNNFHSANRLSEIVSFWFIPHFIDIFIREARFSPCYLFKFVAMVLRLFPLFGFKNSLTVMIILLKETMRLGKAKLAQNFAK